MVLPSGEPLGILIFRSAGNARADRHYIRDFDILDFLLFGTTSIAFSWTSSITSSGLLSPVPQRGLHFAPCLKEVILFTCLRHFGHGGQAGG